jgi:hypothetical protein
VDRFYSNPRQVRSRALGVIDGNYIIGRVKQS